MSAVETLVVGSRGAQVLGGKVLWGDWDELRKELKLDNGATVNLAGRRVTRG